MANFEIAAMIKRQIPIEKKIVFIEEYDRDLIYRYRQLFLLLVDEHHIRIYEHQYEFQRYY